MKKAYKILFASLAAVLFFTGCSVTDEPDSTNTTQAPSPEHTGTYYDNLEVKYIRTDGYIDGREYPITALIESESDLAQYITEYKDDYYLDEPRGENESFTDTAARYDASFFENNALVIVLLEEGSGSISHEVIGVEVKEDLISADIKRIVPEVGTADMAEWHIIIELPKDGVSSQNVAANITE